AIFVSCYRRQISIQAKSGAKYPDSIFAGIIQSHFLKEYRLFHPCNRCFSGRLRSLYLYATQNLLLEYFDQFLQKDPSQTISGYACTANNDLFSWSLVFRMPQIPGFHLIQVILLKLLPGPETLSPLTVRIL